MKATELLAIALAESGYIGHKTNADLDNPTANAGGKYTKYARDLFAARYYNGNKNGYDYCCVFPDWCFYVAAGRDKAAALAVKPVHLYGASVGYIKCMFPADRIGSGRDAAVGDQIVFNNGTAGKLQHTGLIASVDTKAGTITTIEGNITDKHSVESRTFKMSDPRIEFVVHPYYEPENAVTVPEEKYNQLVKEAAAFRAIKGFIEDGHFS